MTIKMLLAAIGTVALLAAAPAFAQAPPEPAPTTSKPAKPAKTTKPKPVRSAKSLACSKEADDKNLHGAARKKFRATCMKSKS